MTLVAGAAAAILVWWVVKLFAGANPAKVAALLRTVGGWTALAAAALLLFRGRLDMALLLGSGGAWLLGWNALPFPFGSARATPRKAGAVSRVRSACLEMELDHDSGRMSGRVLSGAYAGQALDGMGETDLLGLLKSCLVDDPDGARLVESYLDRRFPRWREHAEPNADAGGRGEAKLGPMAEQEAYEILGLRPGVTEAEITATHRRLMRALHPDTGGSTYLASRVNQAKDVLLNRHR